MKNADQASRLPTTLTFLAAFAFLLSLSLTSANGQPASPETPALNCATPAGIEAVICADPELVAQHRALRTLQVKAPDLAKGLAGDAWMRSLRQQCSADSVRSCLLDIYFFSLKNLAADALFRESEPALEALRLIEPRYAPVYEAIYRYGSIDDEAQRTDAVATLIAPIFEGLRTDPVIAPAFKEIPDARAAAATDKAFSAFLAEAAARDLDLRMPCAALQRRPGLVAVLDAPPDGVHLSGVSLVNCAVKRPELVLTSLRPPKDAPTVSDAEVARASSLDCLHPEHLEALICADTELMVQHQAMYTLLAALRLDVFGSGPSQQEALQRKWLNDRDNCVKEPIRACLIANYFYRLRDVAIAALFKVPDIALQTLHRTDPKTAPIYEAMYRYAVTDDQAVRSREVERLIAPIFGVLHDSFEGGIAPFSHLSSAQSAVESDENFALFLGAAAVSGYEKTLPCAALMRRPGLIKALGPYYGGARDGSLPNSDCDALLPPLPVLDQLARAAPSAQPFCQGTIRYSIGRYYEKILLAARLHSLQTWKPETAFVKPVEENEARFRSEQQPLIDHAKSELADYYVRFFKVGPGAAKVDSDSAIETLVANAFFHCGG